MTTTRDKFATLADARTALSGTQDWDWGTVANWNDWCVYARLHAVETVDYESGDAPTWNHDDCLRAYLVSVGVDPSDFQL